MVLACGKIYLHHSTKSIVAIHVIMVALVPKTLISIITGKAKVAEAA